MKYTMNMVIICFMAMLPVANQTFAQSELIPNGSFDADVDDWEPWFMNAGTIEWTSNQGQPPGALKLIGPDQTAFLPDCFHFQPGTIYFVADGFMETGGDFVSCSLNFAMYSQADDCTGSLGTFPIIDGESISPEIEFPNQWEHLVLEVPIPNDPSETGVLSFRPIMTKIGDFQGDDACIFDNASLRIVPRGVTEVPALSPGGFAVFGVLLALAAFVVLRRASRA